MASIKCPKCGAPVGLSAGDKFVKCTYCASQIFIDKTGAGFYYVLPFQMGESDALGTFRRWAGGPTKVKDLDKLAQIANVSRKFFPVYLFKRDNKGVEQVFVEPAGSTTLPGLHNLKVPGGDMRIFDEKFDVGGAELIKPDIEMTTYLNALPGDPKEQALVYFPIWTIEYVHDQRKYVAIISATSGEVFSSDFPTRGSMAYMAVAGVGFIAFLGEGLLATEDAILAAGLMALTVVGVFLSALFVARRM